MSDKTPDPQVAPTYDSNAGAPANLAVQRPSDDELDQRDREKSRPRRAAGPPLRDDGPDAASHCSIPKTSKSSGSVGSVVVASASAVSSLCRAINGLRPLATDAINDIAEGTQGAVKTVARAVAEGVKEAQTDK